MFSHGVSSHLNEGYPSPALGRTSSTFTSRSGSLQAYGGRFDDVFVQWVQGASHSQTRYDMPPIVLYAENATGQELGNRHPPDNSDVSLYNYSMQNSMNGIEHSYPSMHARTFPATDAISYDVEAPFIADLTSAAPNLPNYSVDGPVVLCEWDSCGTVLEDPTPAGILRHLKAVHITEWHAKARTPCRWTTDGTAACSSENGLELASLGKHIGAVHLKSTVSQCPHCRGIFTRGDSLLRHLRRIHLGERAD